MLGCSVCDRFIAMAILWRRSCVFSASLRRSCYAFAAMKAAAPECRCNKKEVSIDSWDEGWAGPKIPSSFVLVVNENTACLPTRIIMNGIPHFHCQHNLFTKSLSDSASRDAGEKRGQKNIHHTQLQIQGDLRLWLFS